MKEDLMQIVNKHADDLAYELRQDELINQLNRENVDASGTEDKQDEKDLPWDFIGAMLFAYVWIVAMLLIELIG